MPITAVRDSKMGMDWDFDSSGNLSPTPLVSQFSELNKTNVRLLPLLRTESFRNCQPIFFHEFHLSADSVVLFVGFFAKFYLCSDSFDPIGMRCGLLPCQ